MTQSNKVYQVVTDRILKQLETVDASDFTKPWFAIGRSPVNIESKKAYRGINHLTLAGFETNYFGTFKQWQKHDCKVKKGEKASPVVKWTFFTGDKESENAGENITAVSVRYFNVFNSSQVEGDYARDLEKRFLKDLNNHNPIEDCEKLVQHYLKNELLKVKDSDRACYSHGLTGEHIEMPELGQFKDAESYYSTFFHEMGHSTGGRNRLNRDLSGNFGSTKYAFEELIAELTASFLMAETGASMKPRKDHACYLKSWIRALKDDPKYIVHAAQKAQKAADYINEAAANYQQYLAKQAA